MLSHNFIKSSVALFAFTFFSLSQTSAQAQTQIRAIAPQAIAYATFKEELNVYEVAEHQAEFTGGLAAFFKYLDTNIKLPAEAQKLRVDGRAFLSFIVNMDGSIDKVTIIRNSYFKRLDDGKTVELDAEKDKAIVEALNAEAMRVIKTMPTWKPGRQGGQAVRSVFSMPICFR
jgi:periplasmic protein TonB